MSYRPISRLVITGAALLAADAERFAALLAPESRNPGSFSSDPFVSDPSASDSFASVSSALTSSPSITWASAWGPSSLKPTQPSAGRISSMLLTTTLKPSFVFTSDATTASPICTASDVSMMMFASYVVKTEATASSGATLSTMIRASSNAVNLFGEYLMFKSPCFVCRASRWLQTVRTG